MKVFKTPHKKSDEGSPTSAVSAASSGSAGLSSPTGVDCAADGGEDQRGRPTEHQRTASGSKRTKDAVVWRQHDIAVAKRREGDEREVEGIVIDLECAEPHEETCHRSTCAKWAKNSGITAPSDIQNDTEFSKLPESLHLKR